MLGLGESQFLFVDDANQISIAVSIFEYEVLFERRQLKELMGSANEVLPRELFRREVVDIVAVLKLEGTASCA